MSKELALTLSILVLVALGALALFLYLYLRKCGHVERKRCQECEDGLCPIANRLRGKKE